MSLDLLDTPVRLTWDLHGPGAALGEAELLFIAGRIAAGGVFYVTLEERPLAHPLIRVLTRRLVDGGCRVSAVCAGTAQELAVLERDSLPLAAVQLDAATFLENGTLAEQPLREVVDRLRRAGYEPALRLIPLRSNLSVIPWLLTFSRELGLGCFKLPNARIGDSFRSCAADELPRWQDLLDFHQQWSAAELATDELPELEIHDRFLWEIMTPGVDQARSEYGGCQAANSLGHVDAAGTVHACAAWPGPLGSLRSEDLDLIWRSPRRFAVRERIGQLPAGCVGCRDYPCCLGGCRGLGELVNQVNGGRDPMCLAPRD